MNADKGNRPVLLIDRDRWIRGGLNRAGKHALLLDQDGDRCCLGFLARAEGAPDRVLLEQGTPAQAALWGFAEGVEWVQSSAMLESPEELFAGYEDTGWVGYAIRANCDPDISYEEIEARVKAIIEANTPFRVEYVGARKEGVKK